MTKKKKFDWKNAGIILMRAIFFFLFPAVFATAFSGAKYLFTQIGMGKTIEMNMFLVTLIAVCVFTIIFGRFFCGFVCAFGSYGDLVYGISSFLRKKRKKRPLSIPEKYTGILLYGKYVILAGILILCFMGMASTVAVNSPWTVFSRIQSLALPELGIGMVLLVLVTIGMVFEKRFFCRFLCPMGGIFSLLPVLPFSAVKRDRSNCIRGCAACQNRCPANLEIATSEEGDNSHMGECFSCGKCMEICPKGNVHTGFVQGKKQVFYWNVLRGVLFLVIFIFLT